MQPDGLLVAALPAQAALVGGSQICPDLPLVDAGRRLEQHKQLPQLFLKRHAGDGILHPPDLFIVQAERFRSQIGHGNFPLHDKTLPNSAIICGRKSPILFNGVCPLPSNEMRQ